MDFIFSGLLDYNVYKQQLEKVKPASSDRNVVLKRGLVSPIIDLHVRNLLK